MLKLEISNGGVTLLMLTYCYFIDKKYQVLLNSSNTDIACFHHCWSEKVIFSDLLETNTVQIARVLPESSRGVQGEASGSWSKFLGDEGGSTWSQK